MYNNYLPSTYQSYIHLSKYSRFIPELGRRETWPETVSRYFDFFTKDLKKKHNFDLSEDDRNLLEEAVLSLRVMPSMRALMTAGPALERDNIAGYNCSYVAIDRVAAFDEILYILMNGCFHPDTKVKTKRGDVAFKDLTKEDEVLSFDFVNNIYEYIKPAGISETLQSIGKPKMRLEFEDGYVVECTEDHEFYTKNRGWIAAKDLKETDEIQNYNEIE